MLPDGSRQLTARPDAEALEAFIAARGVPLLRVAVMLTASREAGEDLLQEALIRLMQHWRSIDGDPEGYLRRIIYHLAADGWRRHQRWQRRLWLLRSAERLGHPDELVAVDLRDALLRLLAQLPPRQRAVLVLRYFEQLSETETAQSLGCSVGSVKSAASRGLARMRELTAGRPQTARELVMGELW
jgi:RNA polymerase sigma-70 factor (sigma-E family)